MKQLISLPKNVLIFLSVNFFRWFSVWIPIYVLFYQEIGLSNFQILFIYSVRSFFNIIFEVPSGAIGDLWGRKRSVQLALVLQTIGFLIIYFSNSFLSIVTGNMVVGISLAFASGSDIALVYDTLKAYGQEGKFKLSRFLISGSTGAALAAASLIGGFLAEANGFRFVILVNIAAYVVALAISIFLSEPELKTNSELSMLKHMQLSLSAFLKNVPMVSITVFLALFTISSELSKNLRQILLDNFGASGSLLGFSNFIFISAAMAGGLFYLFMMNRKGLKKYELLFVYAILITEFVALGFVEGIVSVILLISFGELARGLASILVSDITNNMAESGNRATVLSLQSFLVSIIALIVLPVFGLITDISSLHNTFIYFGMTFAVIAGTSLYVYKKN